MAGTGADMSALKLVVMVMMVSGVQCVMQLATFPSHLQRCVAEFRVSGRYMVSYWSAACITEVLQY